MKLELKDKNDYIVNYIDTKSKINEDKFI